MGFTKYVFCFMATAGILTVPVLGDPEACFVNLNQLFLLNGPTWPPYFFDGSGKQLLTPEYNGTHLKENANLTVQISVGDSVIVSCGNSGFMMPEDETSLDLNVTCNANFEFESSSGQILNLAEVDCNFPYLPEIQEGNSCWEDSVELFLGYTVASHFFPRYSICFNLKTRIPLYTSLILEPFVVWSTWGALLKFLENPGYYNFSVADLYNRSYFQEKINTDLGLPGDSDKYFDNLNLEPQVMANPDFFYYLADMDTMFQYVNTAPLWVLGQNNLDLTVYQSIIYPLLASNLIPYEIYTGSFGVVTLPHEVTGEKVEMHLGDEVLPIPELFWRVVYAPSTKKAVVILMYNNPFLEDGDLDNLLCTDISDQLPWLRFREPQNIKRGYSIACRYEDVVQKILYMPNLDVNGIIV